MRVLQGRDPGGLDLVVGVRGRAAIPLAFGFAAQAAQVVLARELLTVFGGNELAIAVVFGAWLLWVSLGSGLGAYLRSERAARAACLAGSLVLAFVLPAAIWAIRGSRGWFDVPAGKPPPLGGLVLVSALVLALPCVLLGAAFAWALSILRRADRTYLLEALGAAFGAAAVAILARHAGAFALAALAIGILFAGLAVARAWRPVVALGLGLSLALGVLSGRIDRAAHELYWRHLGPGNELVEILDTAEGPVATIERGGETSIYRSGRLWATLPERGENAPIACAVLVQNPAPGRVLLAGASATLLRETLAHPVVEVGVVETDLALLELVARLDPGPLAERRVTWIEGDVRRTLRNGDSWDVVLVVAGEPDTALANRHYTREFFEIVADRLAPGGVFAVGPLAAPTTYAPEEILRRNSTIYRTIRAVFPRVLVTPGPGAWLLASRGSELTLDEFEVVSRADLRGRDRVDLYGLVEKFYVEKTNAEFRTGRRYDPLAENVEAPQDGSENTDARPIGYYESLLAWAWEADDPAGRVLAGAATWPFPLLVGLFAFPALFRRRAVSMFLVGFAGMALTLGGILGFQAAFGHVHEALGLLVAAFMLGTAAGALPRFPAWLPVLALALLCAALAVAREGYEFAALLPCSGCAVGAA
ncbi:MAG: hypothetical protein HY720_03720 [Planctomycetes bacterium]|nr:hypothetical protein [Planctomycetota bacterium]